MTKKELFTNFHYEEVISAYVGVKQGFEKASLEQRELIT